MALPSVRGGFGGWGWREIHWHDDDDDDLILEIFFTRYSDWILTSYLRSRVACLCSLRFRILSLACLTSDWGLDFTPLSN
jgi:hypothetical protein